MFCILHSDHPLRRRNADNIFRLSFVSYTLLTFFNNHHVLRILRALPSVRLQAQFVRQCKFKALWIAERVHRLRSWADLGLHSRSTILPPTCLGQISTSVSHKIKMSTPNSSIVYDAIK